MDTSRRRTGISYIPFFGIVTVLASEVLECAFGEIYAAYVTCALPSSLSTLWYVEASLCMLLDAVRSQALQSEWW